MPALDLVEIDGVSTDFDWTDARDQSNRKAHQPGTPRGKACASRRGIRSLRWRQLFGPHLARAWRTCTGLPSAPLAPSGTCPYELLSGDEQILHPDALALREPPRHQLSMRGRQRPRL